MSFYFSLLYYIFDFFNHLQLAAMFSVLFCGEDDSFLAGDGAREWASRHSLAPSTVGEVEKVRMLCYAHICWIVFRILTLPGSVRCSSYKPWLFLGRKPLFFFRGLYDP